MSAADWSGGKKEEIMYAIEKKIEWSTTAGKKAVVAIRLQTRRAVSADGEMCEVACCDLGIVAEVEGHGITGYGIDHRPITVNGIIYPGRAGKLAIPAAQLQEIDATLAEVYATPEWQAKVQAEKNQEAASREYDAYRARMAKVMG